jgi:hypothetical protein
MPGQLEITKVLKGDQGEDAMLALMNRVKAKIGRVLRQRTGRERPPLRALEYKHTAWLRSGAGSESCYDSLGRLRSCLCTQEMLESPEFVRWLMRIEPSFLRADGQIRLHRKVWEYCYIVQALYERGLLRPDSRGLGFAVGREPLPSYFASQGCAIVATDLDTRRAEKAGWAQTNQHADNLKVLNERGHCPPKDFNRLVSFQHLDMNRIPDALNGFDFCWSSCSFEHLGSIRHGEEFVVRMLDTLKPGGVGVHTTEFNLLSNDATVDNHQTVLFRKRDLDAISSRLRALGHHIDLVYQPGDGPADLIVDVPPYKEDPHLKLHLMSFTTTSIGLIITKAR